MDRGLWVIMLVQGRIVYQHLIQTFTGGCCCRPDACQYHWFSIEYSPWRSDDVPLLVYKHAPISSVAVSDLLCVSAVKEFSLPLSKSDPHFNCGLLGGGGPLFHKSSKGTCPTFIVALLFR